MMNPRLSKWIDWLIVIIEPTLHLAPAWISTLEAAGPTVGSQCRGNFMAYAIIGDGLVEGWNMAAKNLKPEDEEDDISRFGPSLWR
jgi:hypothetical protein